MNVIKLLLCAVYFFVFCNPTFLFSNDDLCSEYREEASKEVAYFLVLDSDGDLRFVNSDEYSQIENVAFYKNIVRGFLLGLIAPVVIAYRGKKVSPFFLAAPSFGLCYDLNLNQVSQIVGGIGGYVLGLSFTSFFLREKLKNLIIT